MPIINLCLIIFLFCCLISGLSYLLRPRCNAKKMQIFSSGSISVGKEKYRFLYKKAVNNIYILLIYSILLLALPWIIAYSKHIQGNNLLIILLSIGGCLLFYLLLVVRGKGEEKI